ncbi:hypothetical protein IE53DRAFT_178034 [Violaceomyces palustris]|uniref:Uncharacterized protein n=1 Tax=Violaceomyces palustris TaxID=1673888 RepID=A0ACD0NSJ3_9BASI|nr:hypothetical protein IE53DRAFT_178034 [Violaceomyces palustris]
MASTERFRLHLEEHEKRKDVKFDLFRSIQATISSGKYGSLTLVPHLALPFYGIYLLLARYGLVPDAIQDDLLPSLIPLVQAFSLGAALGLATMRIVRGGGGRERQERKEHQASSEEWTQVAMWSFVYLFLACLIFEFLPSPKPVPSYPPPPASSHPSPAQGNLDALNRLAEVVKISSSNSGTNRLSTSNANNLGSATRRQSGFASALTWIWHKLSQGPRLGLWELGPNNWDGQATRV